MYTYIHYNIIFRFFYSTQLQLSQPRDKLTDEEINPYVTVSIIK